MKVDIAKVYDCGLRVFAYGVVPYGFLPKF